MGEETDKGKFLRVQGVGGGFITQAPHGAITGVNPATDVGSLRGWGRTYHICGVLPQDSEVCGVPSAWMSGNFPQRRSDAVTFHVHKSSIEGRCATGGEWAASPLQHVENSHVVRTTDQALEDGALFQ